MKKIFTTAMLLILLVFSNTANGQWVQTNGPFGGRINSLAVSGTNIFAGIEGGGVFLSSDNGSNWTAVNNGLTSTIVRSLAVSGTNIFAGTDGGGVFLSSDNGSNWTAVNNGLTNLFINSLAVSGTNIFAGTLGGVFLSSDNGSNWTAVNNGLTTSTAVLSLAVSGTNIFAGTFSGGVFTSTLSGIITDVKEISNSIPNNFVLSQNYPNPFNPSTNINFSVPLSSFVTVKIYDVLGKEVSTLVNEYLKAGSYKFNFNANGLTSGIYFYRLQVYTPGRADNFTQTKKMILLR